MFQWQLSKTKHALSKRHMCTTVDDIFDVYGVDSSLPRCAYRHLSHTTTRDHAKMEAFNSTCYPFEPNTVTLHYLFWYLLNTLMLEYREREQNEQFVGRTHNDIHTNSFVRLFLPSYVRINRIRFLAGVSLNCVWTEHTNKYHLHSFRPNHYEYNSLDKYLYGLPFESISTLYD